MSAPTSTSITFPHPVLTQVIGTPSSQSIQTLKKELYANARAVHSTNGGGQNGHLGLIMPAADYLARTNMAFPPPAHPGAEPAILPGTPDIDAKRIIRQYESHLKIHETYNAVNEALKQQILLAVHRTYLASLDDAEMGFADVSAQNMLAHLVTRYGSVTGNDIELNRNRLSTTWDPDEPIENVWTRISEVQRYAIRAGIPIHDTAVITLTLAVFTKSGVLDWAIKTWRRKNEAEQTLDHFIEFFTDENKERKNDVTAATAGFHGANAATIDGISGITDQLAAASITSSATNVSVGDTKMFYCWTHGLGFNPAHTGTSCMRRDDGHKEEATVKNMMGGCNLIMRPRTPRSTTS